MVSKSDVIVNNILYRVRWIYYYNYMIEKVLSKHSLKDWSKIKDDLRYWLSKTPQQRIDAMEFLRRQYYGDSARLQRTIKVVKRS